MPFALDVGKTPAAGLEQTNGFYLELTRVGASDLCHHAPPSVVLCTNLDCCRARFLGETSKLHQPFVEAGNVRRLYRLKLFIGKHMTVLINEAIGFHDGHVRFGLELSDAQDALERATQHHYRMA